MKFVLIAAAFVASALPGGALAAATTAVAQPRMLPAGSEVRGAAGKPGSVDLYSFMTLPGDTHRITVRSGSSKPIEVQLLDPGGNVIMKDSGVGELKIEAVASWGDAYSVAVIRAQPATTYSIQRDTAPGTLQQFVMAHMAGYTRDEGSFTKRCWTEPGRSLRTDYGTFVTQRMIDGRRTLETHTQKQGGKQSSSVITLAIDRDVIAITEEERGEVFKNTRDLRPQRIQYDPVYKFTGYLCE